MHILCTVFLLICGLCYVHQASAQRRVCDLLLRGIVKDEVDQSPQSYATIYIEEMNRSFIADSNGVFSIKGLCKQTYHLHLTHIGCIEEVYSLDVTQDTFLSLSLRHDDYILEEINIHSHHNISELYHTESLSTSVIQSNANKDIAELLQHLPGVQTLKSGVGISKPIIEGLFGNRIDVLNNGVVQSGQIWGSDHALEIDPFSADRISILKGIDMLAFSSNLVGSVVAINPSPISEDKHWHGRVNYIFSTNNLGHTINTTVEKYNVLIPFRAGITVKKNGDSKAPDYYLTGTGKEEIDFNLYLNKEIKQWNLSLYYSLFTTTIGILRGSQISNITDLQAAIGRKKPFFTSSSFSYDISAPNQKVAHHLLKSQAEWRRNKNQSIHFAYSLQTNDREEFDIRRGNRTNIPSLSIQQYTQIGDASVKLLFPSSQSEIHTGLQLKTIFNSNNLATGILPLIPDYTSLEPAAFFTFRKKTPLFLFEGGGRLVYQYFDVTYFQRSIQKQVDYLQHQFINYTFLAGLTYKLGQQSNIQLNVIYATRNPAINELYSQGLHQGISGLEEGNPKLLPESGLKFTLTPQIHLGHKFSLFINAFYQSIQQYIYLQPGLVLRLTIRGAFPVYTYQQTNARIYGGDIMLQLHPSARWNMEGKFSLIRGDDVQQNIPLINMPSDRITLSSGVWLSRRNSNLPIYLGLQGDYIFKQTRLNDNQDFLAPPEAYFLMGAKIHSFFNIRHHEFEIDVQIENMFNTSYREYLNKLRYFSDEVGMHIGIHLKYKF